MKTRKATEMPKYGERVTLAFAGAEEGKLAFAPLPCKYRFSGIIYTNEIVVDIWPTDERDSIFLGSNSESKLVFLDKANPQQVFIATPLNSLDRRAYRDRTAPLYIAESCTTQRLALHEIDYLNQKVLIRGKKAA